MWASLVVQWLRLRPSTAGAQVLSLGGEVLHAVGWSQKKKKVLKVLGE